MLQLYSQALKHRSGVLVTFVTFGTRCLTGSMYVSKTFFWLRVQGASPSWQGGMVAGGEAAGHITSAQKTHRNGFWCSTHYFLFLQSRTLAHGMGATHIQDPSALLSKYLSKASADTPRDVTSR